MGKLNPVDAEAITEPKQIAGEKNIWLDREKMEDFSNDAVTGEKYVHYPEVVVFSEQFGQFVHRRQCGHQCRWHESHKTLTGPQWNHESRGNFQLGLTAVFME